MTFCLNTTIISPEKKEDIKNAVILLHGYGGDGKDISILALSWKRHLENTIFICPDGPEECQINPSGRQWFDLSNDNKDFIIHESLKAEKTLIGFINEIKNYYNLEADKICLSGFSQGCMMSINVGLIVKESFNSILGFSGKIINEDNLSKRINSKPSTLLIHGSLDEIVPSSSLLEAKDFFQRHKISIETLLIENCGHHIPVEASSKALDFIKKKLYRK